MSDFSTKVTNIDTLLIIAAQDGNINEVRRLILEGADVNVRSRLNYDTPLHFAAYNGNKETVNALLEANANVDQEKNDSSYTILHYAVYNGHKEIVEALLKRGVNVNTKGKPTLCFNHTDKALINWAKNKGLAYVTVADCGNQHTALHLAAEKGYVNIVEQLIKIQGIDVNAEDNNGHTALHLAARSGNKEIVDALLKVEGININVQDNNEYTSLRLAVENQHLDIAEALVTALLNKNVSVENSDGNIVLLLAAEKGYLSIVEQLIKIQGIDVNAKDNNGYTALHSAIKSGNKEIVDALLEKGAKDNITNTEEQTSTFFDNFFSIIIKPFSLVVSFFSGFFSWLFGSNEEKIDESISQPNASISLLPLDSSSEKKTDLQPGDHSFPLPDQSVGQSEGSDSNGQSFG